ncbi:hypothetical protein [Streptomyces sp. Rer75]|uniref:hypothetical protein n=1 Tax=Streptomyces sp. Rer75 TaxID=2750011 RepID=UPI0015D0113E|nr:hypothetical protein [Streptomyces sp. Rer75]QLH24415.1 hypothetical protein HYQ63_30395 [Streptomyces sp. Rer75]
MLSLRLARGSHPLVLLRRSLVAVAAAGASFLLLTALGFAANHPADPDGALARLLWCVVPLAATVQLAMSVARADPSTRPGAGFAAAGLGPARLALLAGVATTTACAAGSALALLAFLHLRGDVGGSWLLWAGSGAAGRALGGERPLPLVGAVTLVAVVPVVAGAATAAGLWPRPSAPGAGTPRRPGAGAPRSAVPTVATGPLTPVPHRAASALPWGVALLAVGLALEAYAGRGAHPSPGALVSLSGRFGGSVPEVVGGWVLTVAGLVLAGPGLVHGCGRLLAMGRPRPLRLLAGRMLQQEAGLIGRPVGVLCAVAAGLYGALRLHAAAHGRSGADSFGPLTELGVVLVLVCAFTTVLNAALEARSARRRTTAALLRLGASARLLRGAAVLRGAALLLLLAPVAWGVGQLTTMPFTQS